MSDTKHDPIELTAGEAVKLSQAYQTLGYARRSHEQASDAVFDILRSVFDVRKLPEDHQELPWMMEIDGDEVRLVHAENGEDAGQ